MSADEKENPTLLKETEQAAEKQPSKAESGAEAASSKGGSIKGSAKEASETAGDGHKSEPEPSEPSSGGEEEKKGAGPDSSGAEDRVKYKKEGPDSSGAEDRVKYKKETYSQYNLENKYSFAEYQLSDFADAFKMYDIMGDNFLSSAQLLQSLTWLGENPPDAEYLKVVDKVDVDGTDSFSFQNMLDILSHFSHAPITEMELQETFELLDQDRSGTVDAGELKRLMTCVGNALTQEEAEAMIAEADDDCSGEVDFDEFSHTILSTQY